MCHKSAYLMHVWRIAGRINYDELDSYLAVLNVSQKLLHLFHHDFKAPTRPVGKQPYRLEAFSKQWQT